jgi:hypothetical protein
VFESKLNPGFFEKPLAQLWLFEKLGKQDLDGEVIA